MSPQTLLSDTVLGCKTYVGRYTAGFTDENHTRQAPGLPNHVAWCLGHLAHTMHRVAEKFDGKPFPPGDFTAGLRGDRSRFGTESVAFASKPTDDPAAYPTFARCTAIFDAACERLAAAVRSASDAQLQQTTKWGQGETAMGLLVARMAFHNGTHTGQIADLRRALGFKSVFA
jgi:hypothetical protein